MATEDTVKASKTVMLPPKIPLTFDRWFWSSDYRKGVTTLFTKLEAGLKESNELVEFVRARADAEQQHAEELRNGPNGRPLDPEGFGFDDGAALLAVYRQMRQGQADLANAHDKVARQLDRVVLAPFENWSAEHEDRVKASIAEIESIVSHWEKQAKEVAKLKERYNQKSIAADEAEDEARFAPAVLSPPPQRAGSPEQEDDADPRLDDDTLLGPSGTLKGEGYAALGRKVGEQAVGLGRAISVKMRVGGGRVGLRATSVDVHKDQTEKQHTDEPEEVGDFAIGEKEEVEVSSPTDMSSRTAEEKGKGKAPLSPQNELAKPLPPKVPETKESLFIGGEQVLPTTAHNPGGVKLLEIAGAIRSPYDWSRLFVKARDTVYKQSVKVPLLGTYEGAQDGESLMIFFRKEVAELEGDTDRAVAFCKELSEDLSVLRLIGEIGNKFMPAQDAYYLWKPEAFLLHSIASGSPASEQQDGVFTSLPDKRSPRVQSPRPGSPANGLRSRSVSPAKGSSLREALAAKSRFAINDSYGLNRSATLSKYFQTAVKNINDLTATAAAAAAADRGETKQERTHRDAVEAERLYSDFVRRLDQTRLRLEEGLSEHLAYLQRCEHDRLRATKAVILGYNAAIGLPTPVVQKSAEIASLVQDTFSPEADVAALVERYRTGPFRPQAAVFQCHYGEDINVNFGVDLVKWFDGQDAKAGIKDIPPVLEMMLTHLKSRYDSIESHSERRKCWIYDVPLRAVHSVREAINYPSKPFSADMLARLDPPLIASTVKLWFLELVPPPVLPSRYDEVKAIYASSDTPQEAKIEVLKATLGKLPKVHVHVINALVEHLRSLVQNTKTDEDDEIFLTKLGLSLSSTIIRMQVETPVTLSDRFQSLFLVDLIKHYDVILPPTLEVNRLKHAERVKPKRQRTRPVDMRVRRSALGTTGVVDDGEAQRMLQQQRKRQSGVPDVPPVPSLPKTVQEGPKKITELPPSDSTIKEDKPSGVPERIQTKSGTEPVDLPFTPPTSSPTLNAQSGLVPPISTIGTTRSPSPTGTGSPDLFHDAIPEDEVVSSVEEPKLTSITTTSLHKTGAVKDIDDIPLTPSSALSRVHSGGTGVSLSRSSVIKGHRAAGPRGPRSSIIVEGSSGGGGGGSSSSTPPSSIGGNVTSPILSHSKGSPSINSLRAQFESKPGK